MKCPKCGFISFDDLAKCKKCGASLKSPSSPVKQLPSEKKDFNIEKTSASENSFRPPNMDRIIASIKSDLEEIEKLPGDGTSDMTCPSDDISYDMQQHTGSDSLSHDLHLSKNAGFFLRLLSYTIDNVILYVISTILLVAAYFLIGSLSIVEDNPVKIIYSLYVPFLIASTIIEVFYFTYFHAVTGQTVGKWVCGIKVVAEDGNPLGFKKAFIRFLGYIISRLSFYIGFLWIAFDRNKQGWHDKIAKTSVIRL